MKFQPPVPAANALLRIDAACSITGYSRGGLYEQMANGLMTRPIKISARASAVPAREVDAINAARIRGASDDEIRALVDRLHADRNNAA